MQLRFASAAQQSLLLCTAPPGFLTSQTFEELSPLIEAIVLLVKHSNCATSEACPLKVAVLLLVFTSQILMVASPDEDAI